MAVATVQPGQLWRLDETGENWLVTKVYGEAFASYAMLRKVGSTEDVRRVKVASSPRGAELPGFTFAQGSEEF
jgi:hypothetical protein